MKKLFLSLCFLITFCVNTGWLTQKQKETVYGIAGGMTLITNSIALGSIGIGLLLEGDPWYLISISIILPISMPNLVAASLTCIFLHNNWKKQREDDVEQESYELV